MPKSLENKSFSSPHSAWAEFYCQVPNSPWPCEATQCTQATHRHTKLTLLIIHRGPQPRSQFPLELPSPSPRAQEAPRVRPLESCCGLEVWRGCGAGGSFGIRSLLGRLSHTHTSCKSLYPRLGFLTYTWGLPPPSEKSVRSPVSLFCK